MKIAVCDDDKLLTGEIDGQLQRIQQKMGISFETDIFFDGETLWEAIEKQLRNMVPMISFIWISKWKIWME